MEVSEIAKNITPAQFNELERLMRDKELEEIRKKIENQVPPSSKILEQMSENYFFEQRIEITPSQNLVFRTISSGSGDLAQKLAMEDSKEEYSLFVSKHTRRRLSFGLVSINGNYLSESLPRDSYFEMIVRGFNVEESLSRSAEQAHNKLSAMPFVLVDRLVSYYGLWENIVWSRLKPETLIESAKK